MAPASRWVTCAIAAGLAVPLAAQRFETGATAVVVDVVVRDKSGRFVTGLTPADFTVAEDGVAQRITSLQLVGVPTPDGSASIARGASPVPPPPPRDTAPEQPRFTALVFDRIEAANADISRAGAAAAIANASRSDVVAVFLIDHGLKLVQSFTADKARLKVGIDRAVDRAITLITRDPRTGRRNDAGDTTGSVLSAEFPGGFDEQGIQQVTVSDWEILDRQFQGHETIDALLTATAALSTLPGRKTLLYFSDAVAIPDAVSATFTDVVATANRGQVTIYAIDTAGLRAGSQDAETRDQIAGMARAGLDINADGGSSSSLTMLERNEDVLRRSPRVGMTLLAKPTGGFLIHDTNDLANGVRRIDADRRVHYLLTYAPARTELDGKWRAIDVQVNRRNLAVQARQGYVAVRSPGVLPVLVYEGPALAAIDRPPAPREIAARVGAFAFPRAARPIPGEPEVADVAVVVAAPAGPLTFEVKGAAYRTDFTMLALVRDAGGQPTHKTSQPYRLAGLAPDRAKAQAGEVRLSRTLPMGPGSYTVWGSVHDTASGRAGVDSWRVQVDGRGPTGLGVSSLVLLSRLDRVTDAAGKAGDPLVVGDRLITPNLGEPMYRRPDAKLGFYFTVVGADPGERLPARLRFFIDGTPQPRPVQLEVPIALPPADAQGRIACLGQLPLTHLPLASLVVQLTIDRFDTSETRSAWFAVQDPRVVDVVPPTR